MPDRFRSDPGVMEFLSHAKAIYGGSWKPRDWSDYHARSLERMVSYVQARSPFYKRHLPDRRFHQNPLDELERLPVTTKDDLRTCGEDIFSQTIREGGIYYETTGSLGKPVQTPRSWFESFASNFHFSFNFGDFISSLTERGHKPVVGIMGPTEVHPLGDSIGDVCRNIDATHLKFWPYSPKVGYERAAQLIAELQVDVLFGSPATILPVLKLAEKDSSLLRDLQQSVSGVLLLGEVTSNAMIDNISSLFDGAICISGCYGAAETFISASACRFGRLHFAKQNYIAEIVDPQTLAPVHVGQIGELVLTSLIPGMRPMIRYRTGDLVSCHTEECDCGNPVESFVIHGRTADILTINEIPRSARQIEQAIFDGISGIYGYHIEIDQALERDEMKIRVLPNKRSNASDIFTKLRLEEISDQLACKVSVSLVDELPPSVNASGLISWKSAKVKDLRSAPNLEERTAEMLASNWLNGLNQS